MTWQRRFIVGSTFAVGALAGSVAFWAAQVRAAGVPAVGALTYSGTLEDVNGTPVTGTKQVKLQLFDAQSGGTEKCTTTETVTLHGGRFSVLLPDTCTAAVHAAPDLWVEVTVDAGSLGRTKLGAVPYAVEASSASQAAGALATQVVPAGAVMFFDLPACPTGWTEVTDARGRYLVGNPAGGTRGGTAGTPLTNLENRATGQHSHGVTETPHTHDVQRSAAEAAAGGGGVFGLQANSGTSVTHTQSSSTGITINNAGTVAGTNAPYIQFLACRKS